MNASKGVDLKDPDQIENVAEQIQNQEQINPVNNLESSGENKGKQLKLVIDTPEISSMQRARHIKKLRIKRKKKKSIKNKLAFIVFVIVTIVWILTSIILNGFIWQKLLDYNSSMMLENFKSVDIFIEKNISKEIIQEHVNNFKIGKNGFAGILTSSKDELYIGKSLYLKEGLIELIETKIETEKVNSKLLNDYIQLLRNEPFIKWTILPKSGNIGFVLAYPNEIFQEFSLLILFANIILITAGIFIVIILSNIFLKIILVSPFITLINKTNVVRNGDLTVQFEMKRKDEVGTLANAFNDTVGTLKNLVQKVYIAVIIMTKILRGLFKSSKAVTESANAQAITIDQTRGNFEQLNKMVETITKESTKANSYTIQALEKARIGMESIQSLEKEMQTIESSSLEITDIITLINDIAEQTELLSLNASIESARAGEAGKGFNVVAGEVRKLAEKSTQASNRIYELITNNQRIIKVGVNYSKNATRVLRDIAISNELSAGLVKTISEEIIKVQQSSNEILGVINYISEIAQANLIESENVSDATKDLAGQAIGLQEFVGKFDVRPDKIKENQSHIEEILKAKLIEVEDILKEYGTTFLQTGNVINIGEYKVKELQLGKQVISNNNDIVDRISKRTMSSVSFFQSLKDVLIRVATTVKNYDDTRAIGTVISNDNEIFQTVINGNNYFGRAFVVNRWYVGVYRPIVDQTGYVLGVMYLGLPEETELLKETSTEELQAEGVVVDTTFKHKY